MTKVSEITSRAIADIIEYYKPVGGKIDAMDAQLTDIAISVKAFGAKGDGVTDDAPAIRAAIAFLKSTGLRKLFFPSGIYYIASGDPRGLEGTGVFSNGDYYTCFELLDNMIIEGVGSSSKLLYETNRLGYNLATLKGDAGSMFSNFRVLGSDARYVVGGMVSVKNLSIEYTPLDEFGVRDYIDGQILRVIEVAGEKHGRFNIENVKVYNHCGHQCFSVYDAESYTETNVTVHNFAKQTNASNTDFSSCYAHADLITINNNTVKADSEDNNGTAFELHGKHVVINGNQVEHCNTFVNAVGTLDLEDGATFQIGKNKARNVRTFCTYWTYSNRKIRSIDIDDNTFIARANTATELEMLLKHDNDDATPAADMIPVDLISVKNMKYSTNNQVISASDAAMPNSHMMLKYVVEVHIEGNTFADCRRGLIQLNSLHLKRFKIKNNIGKNLGWGIPATITTQSYRSIIYHFSGVGYAGLEKIILSENEFEANLPATAQDSYGYWFNNQSQALLNNKDLKILQNTFVGVVKEIAIRDNAATGEYINSYYIRHRYSNVFASLSTISNVTAALHNGKQNMHKNGGQFTLPTSSGVVIVDMDVGSFIATYMGTGIPTEGYWKKGSKVINSNPVASGYVGWVCVTEGTPGIWKRYGLIEA